MARLSRTKPSSGSTILVVDDDAAIVSTLEQILSHEGHTVLTATSGAQAIELCQNHTVHLMLLDYFMPGMTGEEVVRAVRAFNQEMQIVLQTGYASERPARQMLAELDIQGYHDKSEGPEKLLVWVDAALKAYRQVRALRASRDGLRYILEAAPELHRLQPLEDLLYGILLQIEGLLGLSGTLIALQQSGLLALGDDPPFEVRVGTGRFVGKNWHQLGSDEQKLVLEAARSGQIQWQTLLALPLRAGERVVGVVLVDRAPDSSADREVLELFSSQAAVAIENVRLYELATIDDLTRLATRRHWLVRLDDTLRMGLRHGQTLSVILLDIDHFKTINDTYGHLAGDRVLSALGHTIGHSVRRSDLAGRYGGEEFAVLLPHTPLEGALALAHKLWQAICDQEVPWEAQTLRVTASLGVASLQVESINRRSAKAVLETARTALLQAADEALYEAKNRGRDQVVQAPELSTRAFQPEEAV